MLMPKGGLPPWLPPACRNGDSARQYNETSAVMQDTDWDGLSDGVEDIDHDGIRDSNEPDPLLPDSDGDTIPDGVEFDLMHSKDAGWSLTHDTDGDGIPDILDIDADNDGLTDFEEDYNGNATIDINESDPYVNDTDGDGLLDGAEPLPFEDTDGDGHINARDNDSNYDGVGDADQVYIQFRTNATNGQYVAGTWVALIAPKANPHFPEQFDYSAASAQAPATRSASVGSVAVSAGVAMEALDPGS
jgi:hypothetical protein